MIIDYLISGITQTILVILICGVVFGIKRLLNPNEQAKKSFLQFAGLYRAGFKTKNKFLFVFCGMIVLGISTSMFQFYLMPDALILLKGESSPYYKILKTGINLDALVAGIIYCFVTSGLSEEILFRGLIAKRLISLLGFTWGNVIQATIFWLMHFLLIWWITNLWVSPLQIMTFVTILPMGLVLCFWNEKRSGGSIIPSWIFHATANFATFLTLAALFN